MAVLPENVRDDKIGVGTRRYRMSKLRTVHYSHFSFHSVMLQDYPHTAIDSSRIAPGQNWHEPGIVYMPMIL